MIIINKLICFLFGHKNVLEKVYDKNHPNSPFYWLRFSNCKRCGARNGNN